MIMQSCLSYRLSVLIFFFCFTVHCLPFGYLLFVLRLRLLDFNRCFIGWFIPVNESQWGQCLALPKKCDLCSVGIFSNVCTWMRCGCVISSNSSYHSSCGGLFNYGGLAGCNSQTASNIPLTMLEYAASRMCTTTTDLVYPSNSWTWHALKVI